MIRQRHTAERKSLKPFFKTRPGFADFSIRRKIGIRIFRKAGSKVTINLVTNADDIDFRNFILFLNGKTKLQSTLMLKGYLQIGN
jgi:hypothetical protein